MGKRFKSDEEWEADFWARFKQGPVHPYKPELGRCLDWARKPTKTGYGRTRTRETSEPARAVLTHRMAWQLRVGPIPEGMNVLHTCDRPICNNVDHLYIGTDADNGRDKAERGRAARFIGAMNPKWKRTKETVRVMRSMALDGLPVRVIAEVTGYSSAGVKRVLRDTGVDKAASDLQRRELRNRKIMAMLRAGHSPGKVAASFGVHCYTVIRARNAHDATAQ